MEHVEGRTLRDLLQDLGTVPEGLLRETARQMAEKAGVKTYELLFSRKGEMQMWLSVDDKRIPYRIEFDLAFGSLKAKLASVGTRPPTETDADRAPTFDE